MKFVRTILALVAGLFVAVLTISVVDFISFLAHRPDNGKSVMEQMQEMQDNPAFAKEYVASVPVSAMVVVLIGWQIGAFLGGAMAAIVAGWARVVHAGIIGGVILAGTILNELNMKQQYGFTHPDWMLVLGLLLPLPVSLIAGKIVALRLSSPTPTSTS